MLTESGWYKLRVPQPNLLALAGAHYDLWVVEDMLNHCVQTNGNLHAECEELEEGCWTTAIIRYERAFNGLPSALHKRVLSHLTPSQVESHHFFRYLRDKMFAHRTGVGDDFEIRGAIFPISCGLLGLTAIAPQARRISSLGTDLALEFLQVVVAVRTAVKPLFEQSKEQAVLELRGLPLDEVVMGLPVNKQDLTPRKTDAAFQKYLARALSQ